MTQIIKPKRGTTTPTTSNLVSGEIAVDTANQRLYINDSGSIKVIGDGNTNTTYSAGDGLSLTGTTFNIAGSEIAGSQDLNNFRTTGLYSQNSNADAVSGSNYPVDLAGMLEVLNDDNGNGIHTVQRYSRYNANNVYHRYYYNGTWSSWRDLAQDNNTVYTHPNFNGDDFSIDTGALTGATVISDLDINVTTNTQGHVTDANGTVNTRTLTLADLGYTGATNANNYSLPLATNTVRGGIELFSNTDNPTAANAVTSTASRTYGLQLNSANQGVVNVPWTDTVYTHPNFNGDDFSIDTGPLTGATVISDLDMNITTNSQGHVTDANAAVATRTLTLANLGYTGATNANNYVLPEATATTRGGIEIFSNTDQSVVANAVTSTAGRTYGIQLNSSGQAVVNVPWVDTNTNTNTTYDYLVPANTTALRLAGSDLTTDTITLSSSGATSLTRISGNEIQISSTDTNTVYTHPSYSAINLNTNGATVIDTMTVDTIGSVSGITTRTMTLADLGYTGATNANNYSLPEATSTVRGGIELFSNVDQSVPANSVTTTAGRTYGLQLNAAGQAVVNVPWTDTVTSITQTEGNFDIEPKDAGGVAPTSIETNRCRYFRTGSRCQVDIYVNKITKGSVSGTSPVRFYLPSGIPQPRGVDANGATKVLGTTQIMGVAAPTHGVWNPILTYGTDYIVFEGVGTSGQGRTDPDVLLWQDVIGVGGPTSNWTEWYISLQYEV